MNDQGVERVQSVTGVLLHDTRAADNELSVALRIITDKIIDQLLDYVAARPNDGITNRKSSMQLSAHSDAGISIKIKQEVD